MGGLVVDLANGEVIRFSDSGPVMDDRTQRHGWSVPPSEPFVEHEYRKVDDGSLVIWATETLPDKYTEFVSERDIAVFAPGEWVDVRRA